MDKNKELQNYQERVLTTKRLRGLLKKRRTRLVPESLVEYIRHRFPEIYGPDGVEISTILYELVSEVRSELDSAGIQLGRRKKNPVQHLNRRERNHVIDFAALLTWAAEAAWLVILSPTHKQTQNELTPNEAIELAREGVAWAEITDDLPQRGICMLILANHIGMLPNREDEVKSILRRALNLLADNNDEQQRRVRLRLLTVLASTLETGGEFDQAELVVQECEELITPMSEASERAIRVSLLSLRSTIARIRKQHSAALDYGQQALRWSDPEFNPITHCQLLQSLGLLYSRMEHLEQGLQMFLNAITILENNGLGTLGSWVYINAAESYLEMGELPRAHELLNRIESLLGYESENLPDNSMNILVHIQSTRANLLVAEKEYDKAEELLKWSIDNYHNLNHSSGEVSSCAVIASLYGDRNNPEEACRYIERAIGVSKRSSRWHQLRLHLLLARWKTACNEVEEASRLLDEIEPELRSEQSSYMSLLRLRAEIHEKDNNLSEALRLEREATEIERELLENNRERSIRYARTMAETNFFEQMVEREKEQRQRLEHELAGAVVELGEKRLLIEEVITRLKKELASRESRVNKRFPETISFASFHSILSVLQKGGKDSYFPAAYLGNDNDEFIQQLRRAYPNLTTSQERLCVLLRSGLNAGEICSILDIGSEGLKSRRKRLRKTLGLTKGESLEKALAQV
ncbi:MAG: hypothetical protein KDD67_16170 [Ignavibacteriae bacterium]|nr:hypothetical protein [Ignavibacteriota bacterium]MCB9216836.1 hypothetical protein [Ignavibacteria bacterium]